MRGIIWYASNLEAAENKLKSIIEHYECNPVSIVANSHTMKVCLENGDIWDVLPASESSRGYKCNISYISNLISQTFINTVIKPITIQFPYQGFATWHEEEEIK